MKEEAKVNYAFALKNHQQKGWGRSMKKFCDEGGYDYEKFMQYSRQGQKEYSPAAGSQDAVFNSDNVKSRHSMNATQK